MQISRGRPISARAIASICCSPPDKRAGALVEPLGDARKQRQHALEILGDGVCGRRAA